MYPVKNVKTKREKELKEKREQTMQDNMDSTTFVDFGDVDDQQQYRIKKIRVKVCGRYIYSYRKCLEDRIRRVYLMFYS
jgi:hypothetical protein